jgi:hypothetical protein
VAESDGVEVVADGAFDHGAEGDWVDGMGGGGGHGEGRVGREREGGKGAPRRLRLPLGRRAAGPGCAVS